jgi:hypothetical protein
LTKSWKVSRAQRPVYYLVPEGKVGAYPST